MAVAAVSQIGVVVVALGTATSALAQDIKQMAGEPKWQPPVKDDQPPESAAAVRGLMADNRAAPDNWVEL